MSNESPPPSGVTEGGAPPGGTLAATLARPDGPPSPLPGSLEATFAPPARPDEVGTFAPTAC
jgi:hypothetical protein